MKLAISLLLCTLFFGIVAMGQNNPAPFLNQPLVPEATTPGSPGFTLTLNGTGFVSGAVVNWNGNPLATTFISGSQLTATVPASDIATPTTATITVTNPSPGGGISNIQYFPVATPAMSLAFAELTTTVGDTSCAGAAAADFNGDGKIDVAYSCNLTKTSALEIALGNGDGTFQTPVSYPIFYNGGVTSPLANVILGNFTSSGDLDIAGISPTDPFVSPEGTAQILLGNGNGTFQGATLLNVGADQMAAGDFNKDGKLDLAAAETPVYGTSPTGITILLGNGDGTFQTGATYDSTVSVDCLAVGDFDSSGNLDIAYIASTSSGTELRFLHGNGDGTFQGPTSMSSPDLSKLIAADVNGDGILDLVGILQGSTNTGLTVFIGNGNGTFQAPVVYGTIPYPQDLIVRDVNADGKLDATILNQQANLPRNNANGAIYFLQGNGDGTFQNPKIVFNFPAFAVQGFTAGDFQGNGRLDFAGGEDTGNFYATLVYTLLQGAIPVGSVSPSSLTYAAQAPGTSSAAQQVTLTNTGSAPLKITSIAFTGSDPKDFNQSNTCGSSVPAYSNCQISVTFTPTAAGNRSATLSIADDSFVGNPQTISLTGTGEDFSLAVSPASLTVTPGQAANYTVTVSPVNGFAQSVGFTCSGAPAGSTCTVTPSKVTLNGKGNSTIAVAVVTAGTAMGQARPFNSRSSGNMLALFALTGVFGMLMLPPFGARRGQSRFRVGYGIMLAGVLSLLLMIPACGGGSSGSSGTPTGTYQLTVAGTYTSGSATLTHSIDLAVVVQ